MHEDRAQAGLPTLFAEALERLRVVLREAPGARALDEELDGVGADLDGAVERALRSPPEQ